MDAVRLRARAAMSVCVVLFMCLAAHVFAQSGTGTITGTVSDNAGVLPGALVTVTNTATGAVRIATTNDVGLFRVAALTPGPYTVKVEVSGFKPLTIEQFNLLAETRDFPQLVLEAGGVTEAITVVAEATPVQVSTSSRQQGITSDQMSNITMKGRDVYGLLATLPGVMDVNLNRDSTGWTSANNITINGAPVASNNIMIDGVAQRDEYGTNAFVNPNMDAIGEVQVVANGFTAENGRSFGGLVNFVTKSGTSTFRGAAWYNMRRDSWNENDYERKRRGQAKPLYRINIPGYSIGGPVIIPRLIDSRTGEKRVFFFISQEFTDDARPSVTTEANYPTERERRGDFSQTYQTTANAYGQLQQIIDPLTGQPFPGNIIPAERINPVGQRLINLLLMPNGYTPPANRLHDANFIDNTTPLHYRTDWVSRFDVVPAKNWRISTRLLANKEDNITANAFGPGFGRANNFVPGWLLGANATHVMNSTTVHQFSGAFTINHYAFRRYPDDTDYTQFYCTNMGVCPPRITPYGQNPEYHPDAPPAGYGTTKQLQQYPYIPSFVTAGGNRANLVSYSPGQAGARVLPTKNSNWRYVFQNDLSMNRGNHSFKFGSYVELDSTHAPIFGSDYMGRFNFGSSSNNPYDTGNGYANMLTGAITNYSEVTNRVAWDTRHWQIEAYAQDGWRVTPRLTMDYGVRFTHSGAYYEVNDSTAAFYPELYNASKAPRLYRPACRNGARGDQACSGANQASIDPANPGVFLPAQLQGTIVPGSGDFLNGMQRGGRNNEGNFYDFPMLRVAPRFGIAWDVNGDGKSAVRASGGVFYNFPRGGLGAYIGIPPVSFNQSVNNLTMDQLAAFSTGGSSLAFTYNPINSAQATIKGDTHDLPIAYNANVAYQRDIGFDTVVEAAYVGSWVKNDTRTYNVEVLPLNFYADPAHQFNQAALSPNYFKPLYPGMGNVTDFTNDLTTLSYNSAQFSAQRRLSRGLQMGLAYTFAKGMGMSGWDPYTADPNLAIATVGGTRQGGTEALKARYWGPTAVDRTHNLVFNYSYMLPTPFKNNRFVSAILGDWQISGVTKWLTGTAVNPTCTAATTVRGMQFANPSFTNGITSRCQLTGQPINDGKRVDPDPNNPDLLTAQWFNLGAFALASPVSSTEGNFGDAPLGLLRNPAISTWDITLARRFPLKIGRNGSARIQFQAYNVFNQVQFTTLNAALQFSGANATVQNNTNAGRYSTVISPRQLGLTIRMDF